MTAAADDTGLQAQLVALAQVVTGLLAEVGELREDRPRRRLYDYDEAAAELRVHPKWLKNRIKTLPHTKSGRLVFFTDDDLDRILALLHVEPESVPVVRVAGGSGPPPKLTPLRGRKTG
ncbi:helix-turn-helix domain-containing protein [Streptomyces phytophilus]|uniref:helix-turn-helix domain-containing protein n=1 Tax=Streptomyces phytophilus TaxID=722715 RepID=UPI0015EFDDB9|nr:helix-turn-helix domain-containing protein [Streptomyces phytophilus]